jgi:KDO2-lipid IV(A) lauroyltransferase
MASVDKGKVTVLAFRGGFYLLSLIPDFMVDPISKLGSKLAKKVSPARYDVAIKHMKRLVPGCSEDELAKLVERSFESYLRYWIESSQAFRWPFSKLDANVTCPNLDRFNETFRKYSNAIVVMPHMGNWDVGATWFVKRGYTMTTVAEKLEPPELFNFFVNIRERNGLKVVGLDKDATAKLVKEVKSKRIIGLLSDRDIQKNGVEVTFFGEKTTLPMGPAVLSIRTKIPIVIATVYSSYTVNNSRFTVDISAPIEFTPSGDLRSDIKSLTQLIALNLETAIKVAPTEWHVFQPNWPADEDIS